MTATAIKKQLDNYLPLLSLPQQELLLQMAKSLLHVETKDQRVSVKQYNKELKASEKQIAEGKFTTQADLEKESEKW
ncbi:MAG: hypothetical protein Q8M29_01495 [Bacteroidota bacterium]|nr:hypothetical protein [Bacteroidota bacterium]